MNEIIMARIELYLLSFLIEQIPIAFWSSILITFLHTANESSDWPTIWHWLGVPAWLYFVFQVLQLVLAWFGVVEGVAIAALLLIAVRIGDAGFTHGILERWKGPSPGGLSAVLLWLDAAVIAVVLWMA